MLNSSAAFTSYLDGRDWVSINRGEVIDVEHLTGRG
jgi:hypothetical protein